MIGAGRAGCALAVLLAQAGWEVAAVASRRLGAARSLARRCGAPIATVNLTLAAFEADATLIAVPDREIAAVATALARVGPPGLAVAPERPHALRGVDSTPLARRAAKRGVGRRLRGESSRIALHTSGAVGAEALGELEAAGWLTGTFHPLISFPPVRSAPPGLEDATVAIDGDPRARRLARALAASLGARPVVVPSSRRAAYHLAACFGSNYLLMLVEEAASILSSAGFRRGAGIRALLPLIRSTLANLESARPGTALTGPVVRGDDDTIGRHAAILRRGPRGRDLLHRHLVRRTVELARAARRIDAAAARRILRALLRGRPLQPRPG